MFWWIVWITLTIVSFFVAVAIWTPIIASRFGSVRETRNSVIWVTAVFGTWMVILVPLIIMMYQKVDKAYEDARNKREQAVNRFRSVKIDLTKRLISPELAGKLAAQPEIIQGGHLVTVKLGDGRKIPHVFIANKNEILGIYDAPEMNFTGQDVQDLEIEDMLENPPSFFTPNWLRLDGMTQAE